MQAPITLVSGGKLARTWKPPCPFGEHHLSILERRNGGDGGGHDDWSEDQVSCRARAQQALGAAAVMDCAKRGECSELLLGAVHVRDAEGATALTWSSRHGQVECVRKLLEAGARVDAADDAGWTPLMEASYARHPDVVRALLASHADPLLENRERESALSNAREVGASECVQLLRASLRSHELMIDASKSGDLVQLAAASDAGVQLDDANRLLRHSQPHHAERSTVLHWASAHGHVAAVRRLLELGADVDASDRSGWTALMAAVCNHELETVRALLDARADPLLSDATGSSAVDCATRWPPSPPKAACAALLLEAVRERRAHAPRRSTSTLALLRGTTVGATVRVGNVLRRHARRLSSSAHDP